MVGSSNQTSYGLIDKTLVEKVIADCGWKEEKEGTLIAIAARKNDNTDSFLGSYNFVYEHRCFCYIVIGLSLDKPLVVNLSECVMQS